MIVSPGFIRRAISIYTTCKAVSVKELIRFLVTITLHMIVGFKSYSGFVELLKLSLAMVCR